MTNIDTAEILKNNSQNFSENGVLIDDLCYEIDELRAENERLRAALKPFADEAAYWFCHNYNREDKPVEGFSGYQPVMTCGDLFNARAALNHKETSHD